MKAHRRDRAERAFNTGFRAGSRGKSAENCPYISVIDKRAAWMQGWREGREAQI